MTVVWLNTGGRSAHAFWGKSSLALCRRVERAGAVPMTDVPMVCCKRCTKYWRALGFDLEVSP